MIDAYAAADRALRVAGESRRWEAAGLVSADQGAAVRRRFRVDLVRVHRLLRLLLAGFTALAVVGVAVLAALLFEIRDEGASAALLAALGVGCWLVGDRWLIAGRNHHRCGAEEALVGGSVVLLSAAVALALSGFGGAVDDWAGPAGLAAAAAGGVWLAHRYGYAWASLGSVVALASIPLAGAEALRGPPFAHPRLLVLALMVPVGVGAGVRVLGGRGRPGRLPSSVRCLETASLAALTIVYLAVNLYLHRVGWGAFEVGRVGGAAPLPAWFDRASAVGTALFPLGCLAVGIGRRERGALWLAVATAAASLATLGYYLHLGWFEEVLTLSAAGVLATVILMVRWLKAGTDHRRGSFTAEPFWEPRLYGAHAEAVLAALGTPAVQGPAPGGRGFRPGGGGFGGGGAGGGF